MTGTPIQATPAVPASAVGTYSITLQTGSLSAHNYIFTPVNGTLTITKAPLTVKAKDATRVYGGANPAFAYTVSGFLSNDPATVVTGTPVLTTPATPASDVGPYAINVAPGSLTATNYSFTFVPGTLSVTKAVLTVKATDQTRAYGAANPTLTYGITGFANGDTAVMSGVPTLATTATATSVIGAYPITTGVGGMSSTNYTFTGANGTLTVVKAALTVTATDKAKTFGQANPALTYTITGFSNGQTASVVTGAPVLSTTATTASPAGTYPINLTAGNLASTNYSFTLAAGTLTVNKATLAVTAANKSKVYGQANPALTYTITGFVNGNTSSVVTGAPALSTPATATSDAGTYAINVTAGTLAATNYTFTLVPGTLTVTKSPVAIVATPVKVIRSLATNKITFTATVTSATTGAPVAGLSTTFTITLLLTRQKLSCTATTAADGTATCTTGQRVATLILLPSYSIATVAGPNTRPAPAPARSPSPDPPAVHPCVLPGDTSAPMSVRRPTTSCASSCGRLAMPDPEWRCNVEVPRRRRISSDGRTTRHEQQRPRRQQGGRAWLHRCLEPARLRAFRPTGRSAPTWAFPVSTAHSARWTRPTE